MSDKQVCDRCETEAQREDNCGYYLSAFYIRAACTHQNTAPQVPNVEASPHQGGQATRLKGETPASAVPTPLTDRAICYPWELDKGCQVVRAGFARQLERALSSRPSAEAVLIALRRIVEASDKFVSDTGMKHGDLLTDAVDAARPYLSALSGDAAPGGGKG